jgi:hypothetical protein
VAGRVGSAARLGAALALVALAIRAHNALVYPADWGFDASFNWRYIFALTRSWALPPPDESWSASDPPLYFYLAALVMRAIDAATGAFPGAALLWLNTLLGLGIVALAAHLVLRADPERPRRAWLAALLLLFLPAHVQMSAMASEEMLAALFTSLAVWTLARRRIEPGEGAGGPREAAEVGCAGGLAALTKLSGGLAVAAAALTYLLEGWRTARLRPGLVRAATATGIALLLAGWFHVRGPVLAAHLDPRGLPVHERMLSMPPGERDALDYLRIPLATWTRPQLLDPDLLRSVWGSTFVSAWFDGHRYFLPRGDPRVDRLGTVTLLLALLPTAAFARGAWSGLRRARRRGVGPDAPLLLLVGITLAAYAVYTWRNPYFAVVKGTSLLGLSLPFAYYASEGLERWLRGRPVVAAGVATALLALFACVAASSSFGLVFEKSEIPGLPWR